MIFFRKEKREKRRRLPSWSTSFPNNVKKKSQKIRQKRRQTESGAKGPRVKGCGSRGMC